MTGAGDSALATRLCGIPLRNPVIAGATATDHSDTGSPSR